MSILTEREWEAAKPYSTDKVSVKKLRIDEANAGFDIWGRPKNQPVEISVVLALSQPFSSAAATDTVNESTVHYGKLSKAVIAMVDKSKSQWKSAEEFVQDVVLSAMTAASDKSVVSAIQVDACFTKACRNGSGISIHLSYIPSTSQTSIVMHLRKMWFSALIGVNSNERTMKQRVIVSVWIDGVDKTFTDSCFEAEQIVEKVCAVCLRARYVRGEAERYTDFEVRSLKNHHSKRWNRWQKSLHQA